MHDYLRRCLEAIAVTRLDGAGVSRSWRRRVQPALASLRAYLWTHPAEGAALVRWLFAHDHALLEDASIWAQAFPDLPPPGESEATALLDAALGLPPLPGDEALLREWQARQGHYGAQQVLGAPTPYPIIRMIARHLMLQPGEYLCDLGAGHGRVVLYLALLGRRARGIELLPDRHALAERARRALQIETARFDRGSVLDERFWHGPETVIDAGWYYCYDPFDEATHRAVIERLRWVAQSRSAHLLAFVQTSRYCQRYQRYLDGGAMRLVWPPGARVSLGLHVFRLEPEVQGVVDGDD